MEKIDCLKSSRVFKGLDEETLRKIGGSCEFARFGKGEVVFEEGSMENLDLYVVAEGEVMITTELVDPANEGLREIFFLTLLERGDTFGEIAILDRGPRTATVKTNAETTLLRVPGEFLVRFAEENVEAGYRIMRNVAQVVCRRLREMDFVIKHGALL
ncbi:MAG: cyclic nucleotide-binding domain-containing protein [bacterium]